MNTNQPATDFYNHLKRTLHTLGFYNSAAGLPTGIIITTMTLIASVPHFVLKPIVISHVLSLRHEISILCATCNVDVVFQFDSIMETPTHVFDDFITLNISGGMLSKDRMNWKRSNRSFTDTRLLLNLVLVRTLIVHYGPQCVADIIADFDRLSSLHLSPHATCKLGVGRRVANPFRSTNRRASFVSSHNSEHVPAPPALALHPAFAAQVLHRHTKSSIRFNPFASRTRVARQVKQSRFQLDLDDENSPVLFSGTPLRMRRHPLFRLGRF